MNRRILILFVCAIGILTACEFPKSPDFETSQRVEIPILADKPYQFMGEGSDVLIDTTSTDFDSLFVVDGSNNSISVARTENFDFGDLNNAVPEVTVDPSSINAEVGELRLGSFSSDAGGNLGEATFQQLTGQDPTGLNAGTPIPGGSSPFPVNVPVDTDYFVSATIKSGTLALTVNNRLGFEINQLTLTLNGGTTQLGIFNYSGVGHDSTITESVTFSNGDVLQDLNIDIDITWDPQLLVATPEGIIVIDAQGQDLVASQIVAAVEPQDFTFNDSTQFDDSEFIFEDSNDFVELSEGRIVFQNFRNDIGIGINTLEITFPGIVRPDLSGNYTDTLTILLNNISANSDVIAPDIDLAGARITAPGNQIEYEIFAATENTQQGAGSTPVTITENDQVNATVAIENIVLNRVVGVVVPRQVLLNDDEFADEQLDLFNDNEAELTTIDGLDEISNKVEGLEFTDPSLSILYDTNIGIDTDVIGAFVGINGKGEQVFLTGAPGTVYEVQPTDPISGLNINGVPLQPNQMIKFPIVPSGTDGTVTQGSLTFDRTTSNVDEFLNNLPSEIRFIGKASVNPNSQSGGVGNPVVFDPEISVDLPLSLRADNATLSDTLDADLADLPGEEDDADLDEVLVYLSYSNGLPLGFNLELIFLDENDQEITRTPLSGEDPILIAPGVVDVNGFVTTQSEGALVFRLNQTQLNTINRTRKIDVEATLQTTANDPGGPGFIRFRTDDQVVIGLSLSAAVTNAVN